ncbi:alanine--glyoxylate aminotransferase family protein [Deferribacterales bacterium RsTz2092]
MLKDYLIAPGPTPIPEESLLEMAKPIMHHHDPRFEALFQDARRELRAVFGTSRDVLILACSGTGAMEASVVNTLSAGVRVLVINAGKFGERWVNIVKAYGLVVDELTYDWGYAAKVEDVKGYLDKHPDTRAVFIQGSETSTTVYHPIKELAELIKNYKNTIFVVDGITTVGVYDTKMDEWGIDILITGSQKALMLPPGLAFIALSDKAWGFTKTAKLPKFYFNLTTELKKQTTSVSAWTPAVSIVRGLKKSLELLNSEGLANVYKRHAVCADATREAVEALGLKLFAKERPANSATMVCVPEGIDGTQLKKYMGLKLGVTVANAQDNVKGKAIRISHLGYHGYFDTIIAISALEMALKVFGVDVKLGVGIAAAESVFAKNIPAKD